MTTELLTVAHHSRGILATSLLTFVKDLSVVDMPCRLEHAQTGEYTDCRQGRTHHVSHAVAPTPVAIHIVRVVVSIDVALIDFLSDEFG